MNRTTLFLGAAVALAVVALILGMPTTNPTTNMYGQLIPLPRDESLPVRPRKNYKGKGWEEVPSGPPAVVQPVAARVEQPRRERPTSAPGCRGYTWVLKGSSGELSFVGNGAHSNGYQGDTSCEESLPVLCVKKMGLRVNSAIALNAYNGWLGGEMKLSAPIQGLRLFSRSVADAVCENEFGDGYRMGEHHDGEGAVGWGFTGYGRIPADTHFWVTVNDQRSSPWHYLGQ